MTPVLPRLRRRLFPAPVALRMALRLRVGRWPSSLLVVSIRHQRLMECLMVPGGLLCLQRGFRVSTSRRGTGQQQGSFQTPLGLHRVARKIGAGEPLGTVFRGRRPAGLTRQGMADAAICHRILWLEGLESGLNRGGDVDSFRRFIYIHGFGDETTLGRPASMGCVHMAASDLLPLFDRTPLRTLVWIAP